MKVEKMLMLILMTCSLLLASSNHVTAAEGTGTLEDVIGDVIGVDYIEMTEDIVTESEYIDVENIDIVKVEYTITDESIDFSLQVAQGGIIEDRGSYTDLEGDVNAPDPTDLNVDVIIYSITLLTSKDIYTFVYINNTCRILETETELSNSDFSVVGRTLTISFNLNTSDEEFENVTASTSYQRMIFNIADLLAAWEEDPESVGDIGIVNLIDNVPNGPLMVDAYVTSPREVGKEVEFESYVYDGQPPYTWYWEFGDGETSTDPDPTHTYDTAGEYEYTLTVTDDGGTSESFSGDIEIVGGEDDGTPGFELIVAIAALGFIFLWKRKR
ncbi:MAG: PKD domain-containing protein [Thermoplasmatales archaeon]|nr:PKD domain-containing protein [Thermoplasmatales archaeon]